MTTVIKYTKANSKMCFEKLEDKCCFYSGGVLYMKILQQDLKHYEINNINAVSILNGGLTFFHSDEMVNEAIRE